MSAHYWVGAWAGAYCVAATALLYCKSWKASVAFVCKYCKLVTSWMGSTTFSLSRSMPVILEATSPKPC